MSLRTRLALALTIAALLPLLLLVGLPIFRADARAREETARRVELTRRQATFVVERHLADAALPFDRAAADLATDQRALEALEVGPEERAQATARRLAEAYGLVDLEIAGADGRLLASARADRAAGERAALANLPEDAVAVVTLAGSPVFAARRRVPSARGPLYVGATLPLGDALVRDLAGITGQPAHLVPPGEGGSAGGPAAPEADDPPVVHLDVPLGSGGWRVRATTQAIDAREQRRELLRAFAGIAPLALLAALLFGTLLAERFARPIRDVADRADDIARAGSGFVLLEGERDEARRLAVSFDRMLHALSLSEGRRLAAERVATWQDVARRVAHEVRNALSPIRLAAENLRRTRARAPEALDAALEAETAAILDEVHSLSRLVDEFSQFARLPAPQPVACDARDLVRQTLQLFAQRVGQLGVEVAVDAGEGAGPLTADPDQIWRVLKNVVANALDALEPLGPPARRRLAIALRREPDRLVIEVADNGVGLTPEAARRIFEPYFTTRAERGGTGLGMAIAYRIVTEHGGTIDAHGEPGRGTTIAIRLPARG